MPRRALRSRSLKRVKKKTPGGRHVIRYRKGSPSSPKCAECKKPLAGVPKKRASEVKKLSKSKKRPERAFGGYLCPRCLKIRIKETKVYK